MQTPTATVVASLWLVAGCAGGYSRFDALASTVSPPGFHVTHSAIWVRPERTEFHGRVCRRFPGRMSPRIVRIEKISPAGEVLDFETGALSGLGARRLNCAYYTVRTSWRLAPSDRVRICALGADTACQAPKAPARLED